MGSKVLLVIAVFMATVLLISSEVAPNEYENFNKKDDKASSNGIDESKWGYWGGPWYGGGWGSPYYGWGRPYYGWGWGGPWRGGWGWGGGWRPHGNVQAEINANHHN